MIVGAMTNTPDPTLLTSRIQLATLRMYRIICTSFWVSSPHLVFFLFFFLKKKLNQIAPGHRISYGP